MNYKNKVWMSCLTMTLVVLMAFAPARLFAQGSEQESVDEAASSKIDMTSLILDHISDSYEWHFCGEGESAVAIPLPILLYSKVRSEWFFFSFKHFHFSKFLHFWIF